MRTYQSGTKEKKKKLSKKTLYVILMTASLVVIALIITLSLTLSRRAPVADSPEPTPPPVVDVDVPPVTEPEAPKFASPMNNYSLGKLSSLERLVYSSSMGYWRTHNGVDFSADAGEQVMAVAAGKVTAIQHTVLEATVITVDHGDGLFSYYKGLDTDVAVEVGQEVNLGDRLGNVAANMPYERDEGAHLHLEMKQDGKFVDPLNYIPELGDK